MQLVYIVLILLLVIVAFLLISVTNSRYAKPPRSPKGGDEIDFTKYLVTIEANQPFWRGSNYKIDPNNEPHELQTIKDQRKFPDGMKEETKEILKTYKGYWLAKNFNESVHYIHKYLREIPDENVAKGIIGPHVAEYHFRPGMKLLDLCQLHKYFRSHEMVAKAIIGMVGKGIIKFKSDEIKNELFGDRAIAEFVLSYKSHKQDDDTYLAAFLQHTDIDGWIYYPDSYQIFIFEPHKWAEKAVIHKLSKVKDYDVPDPITRDAIDKLSTYEESDIANATYDPDIDRTQDLKPISSTVKNLLCELQNTTKYEPSTGPDQKSKQKEEAGKILEGTSLNLPSALKDQIDNIDLSDTKFYEKLIEVLISIAQYVDVEYKERTKEIQKQIEQLQ